MRNYHENDNIYQDTFEYRYGREMYELEDYFKQYPVTSFMIARKGKIFVEKSHPTFLGDINIYIYIYHGVGGDCSFFEG